MKLTFTIILCVFLFFLIFSFLGFYSAIRPSRVVSSITPKDFNIPYEDVSFQTSDGLTLKGWFIPAVKPKAKTIILMHGYPNDKGNILESRLFLHKNYNLLFFDFRYFGQSEGSYTTIGKNEVLDLLASIKYLHSRGINEVGVWGLSLGAAVGMMTTPIAPEIKALVAESGYARLDWMAYEYYHIPLLRYPLGELLRLWAWLILRYDIKDVNTIEAARKIKIPILLIHARLDSVIKFRSAEALEKSLQDNPHLEVSFTGGASHGQYAQGTDVIVARFFGKYLK